MRYDDATASTNFTIATHLAKDNFVYYIDNPYTLKDWLTKYATSSDSRKKNYFSLKPLNIVETTEPNLKVVLGPPLLSINWLPEGKLYRSFLKLNDRSIANRIKRIVKKFRIAEYIFINSYNFHYPGVAQLLSPQVYIYHCVDPIIFSFDQKHGLISEEQIVDSADLIICTSKQLYYEKKKKNVNSFFIPNAADIEHSSKAMSSDLAIHSKLTNIPRPIIGYLGNVERRIDYVLLKRVTIMNPDKSFVFTGPVASEFIPEWFLTKHNVYVTGPVPHADIPQVIKGFDIAIIPFKKDEVSATIFPLKLFEYLGAGKPVIATNFNPDLIEHTSDTVIFCQDAISFSSAISESLQDDSKQQIMARVAVAQKNTWTIRAAEIGELIDRFIISGSANPKAEMKYLMSDTNNI